MAGKGLNTLRKGTAERLLQSDSTKAKVGAFFLAPIQSGIFLWKKRKQDTQGKQEEQSSRGSGGTPPPPPDIKSDKKEEQAKIDGIPLDEYIKKHKKW
jgi:hypothetical protein